MTSVPLASGDTPEETPREQENNLPATHNHHRECHPAEVSLDELLDLTREPVGIITDPACRHPHLRRGPRWPDLVHRTLFGSWDHARRVLLYWFALVTALVALAIAATPAIQAGAVGLAGLWWLHRRHTTGTPPQAEPPEPAPALVL
ncbi:hypothetical protein [Amycolatopsis sp. BJA-103]|uniref:hypothetical protein n=1 Tax=unclassified Amycolatopsis TaxID=2618356 RepID=UPI000C787517|nr:hypothetical protein [Amycolatopsis sp. BJA-103]AUI57036.1 hypothetical protein BKN51_01645 [Amycolatopsis sp. BJA-103]PNE15313.1 hypothetical protein B1H26_30015 [Amycolatopsis sp. BJA-103]